MVGRILDFDDNITARAPYPHLNLRVKRNGQVVNTTLNVAPGTPLEMTIFLDDESRPVYGLLASFLKVTDATNRQQEVIVLNGYAAAQAPLFEAPNLALPPFQVLDRPVHFRKL